MDTELHLKPDGVSLSDGFSEHGFSQPLLQLLPDQQKNLELLSHLASYSELLIVVSGPTGIGKSTLAQALAAQREEPEDTLMLQADLMMGLPAILQRIASRWNLPQLSDDLAEAKQAIAEAAAQRQGLSSLVIIDQAEQLDVDTLNDIAHLALLAPQSLSFALFGCGEFESKIRATPTHAPVHHLRIQPMVEEEARQLADQVFGVGVFADDQLKFAYQQAEGLPQIFLRELEDTLLAVVSPENTPVPTGRFPLTHMLAVAGVAAVLIVMFLYQSSEPELFPEPLLPTTPELAKSEPFAGVEVDSQSDVSEEPVSGLKAQAVAVIPSDTESQAVDFNYQSPEIAEADLQTDSNAEIEKKSPPLAVVEPSSLNTGPFYSADEKALLAAHGYVTQLLGSHNKSSAQAFITRWQPKMKRRLYLYEGLHQGKQWHVVVIGIYADRAAAQQALMTFPSELRQQSPWIKNIHSVQDTLTTRQ